MYNHSISCLMVTLISKNTEFIISKNRAYLCTNVFLLSKFISSLFFIYFLESTSFIYLFIHPSSSTSLFPFICIFTFFHSSHMPPASRGSAASSSSFHQVNKGAMPCHLSLKNIEYFTLC